MKFTCEFDYETVQIAPQRYALFIKIVFLLWSSILFTIYLVRYFQYFLILTAT